MLFLNSKAALFNTVIVYSWSSTDGQERKNWRDSCSDTNSEQIEIRNLVTGYQRDANTMAEDIDLEQRLNNLEEEIRLLKGTVFPLIADIRSRVLSPGDEF